MYMLLRNIVTLIYKVTPAPAPPFRSTTTSLLPRLASASPAPINAWACTVKVFRRLALREGRGDAESGTVETHHRAGSFSFALNVELAASQTFSCLCARLKLLRATSILRW